MSNRQVLVVGKSQLTDSAQLEGATIEREQDLPARSTCCSLDATT